MPITFRITRRENGLAYGDLTWPEEGLSTGAVSGPYGRGELPLGLYHVERNKLLDKPNNDPYCDSLKNCWFQVITPQFSTHRTDLGIHPDGNLQGTLGCIGILDTNTKPWYDAFKSVSSGEYTVLEVL
ncbi:MAG: hypothetical protein AAF789_01040 [Bacteroidota bacterium]